MISLVLGIFLVLLSAIALWLMRPAPRQTAGDLRLHAIEDGVFLYRGYFSNSAVLVLKDAVVVVDTQVSPLAAKRLRTMIERATSHPVTHVVNTHYHGDHSGGNAVFPEAEILMSAETARFVVERDDERVRYARTFGLEFQTVHPTIGPTRTFDDSLALDVAGERLEVLHIGAAETTDASVLWWPAKRVLACGDAVATLDYPYTGVPFLDEGLHDDGAWIDVLERIRALRPRVLLPGHGPALVGEEAIARRLDLLVSLYRDLFATVKEELASGGEIALVVRRVDQRLRAYPARPDLREHAVSQRFAIYRCLNGVVPGRAGLGWWQDFRPSAIRRAERAEVERELAAPDVPARAAALARAGKRPLAVALLEAWTESHPDDAAARARLADILLDGARAVRPAYDGMEYIGAASRVAKAALALDPAAPLALLNLGAAEVFGAMMLGQPMAPAVAKLEAALASGRLDAAQRRKAHFCLGKAHQMEQRDRESDRSYRQILPRWARAIYPLLRPKLRAMP